MVRIYAAAKPTAMYIVTLFILPVFHNNVWLYVLIISRVEDWRLTNPVNKNDGLFKSIEIPLIPFFHLLLHLLLLPLCVSVMCKCTELTQFYLSNVYTRKQYENWTEVRSCVTEWTVTVKWPGHDTAVCVLKIWPRVWQH